MRAIVSVAILVLAAHASAESAFVPKMFATETPVLADGEIAVVVDQSGQPKAMRFGDGTTAGGRTILDVNSVIRNSPIKDLAVGADYHLALSGEACYSNGVISLINPTSVYDSNSVGAVTISLASPQYRIESIILETTNYFVYVRSSIAQDRLSAVIQATHQEDLHGYTADRYAYVTSLRLRAYESPESLGSTQDTRGLVILIQHPQQIGVASTNEADYRPVTVGWYDARVPYATARWSDHPATNQIDLRQDLVVSDLLLPGVKRFRWEYGVNGYLGLRHEAPGRSVDVLSVEACDPIPYIAGIVVTSSVADLTWSTNGISGPWTVVSSTNLSADIWEEAVIFSTNQAPEGYMSVTASNASWTGGPVFFRAASGGTQQTARVRFRIPVEAEQFRLAPDTYLYWSNSALWVHSAGSNGLVGVNW